MVERITEVPAASEVAKQLRELSGERHPMFPEFRVYVFRGAELYVQRDAAGAPVSALIMGYGRRKKNIFEPYANWYVAYTVPAERRKGHATALYRHAETEAVARGCRRVRSLAGSAAGGYLHLSLGHLFWGRKETGELFVDSPLPGYADLYKGGKVPPLVATAAPMSTRDVRAALKQGLRYDHRLNQGHPRVG